MAVQGLFGAGVTADGGGDMISPPHADAATVLRTVDLVVIDRDVKNLILDLEILTDLVKVCNFFIAVHKKTEFDADFMCTQICFYLLLM